MNLTLIDAIGTCIAITRELETEVLRTEPNDAMVYLLCSDAIRVTTNTIDVARKEDREDIARNMEENRKHFVNGLASWSTLKKNYARKVLTGLIDFSVSE